MDITTCQQHDRKAIDEKQRDQQSERYMIEIETFQKTMEGIERQKRKLDSEKVHDRLRSLK